MSWAGATGSVWRNPCRRSVGICVSVANEVTLAADGPRSDGAGSRGGGRAAGAFRAVVSACALLLLADAARSVGLARTSDVVHVNGAWTFPVWWLPLCIAGAQAAGDVAARCTELVYLKHSAWKKRLAGWLDRACLRRAAVSACTSEAERSGSGITFRSARRRSRWFRMALELPERTQNAERRTQNAEEGKREGKRPLA